MRCLFFYFLSRHAFGPCESNALNCPHSFCLVAKNHARSDNYGRYKKLKNNWIFMNKYRATIGMEVHPVKSQGDHGASVEFYE